MSRIKEMKIMKLVLVICAVVWAGLQWSLFVISFHFSDNVYFDLGYIVPTILISTLPLVVVIWWLRRNKIKKVSSP
jgi:hypothetical protein